MEYLLSIEFYWKRNQLEKFQWAPLFKEDNEKKK